MNTSTGTSITTSTSFVEGVESNVRRKKPVKTPTEQILKDTPGKPSRSWWKTTLTTSETDEVQHKSSQKVLLLYSHPLNLLVIVWMMQFLFFSRHFRVWFQWLTVFHWQWFDESEQYTVRFQRSCCSWIVVWCSALLWSYRASVITRVYKMQ